MTDSDSQAKQANDAGPQRALLPRRDFVYASSASARR